MGTKARELVKVDVDELIEMLNKALADEWLAYYQYWVGAHVAQCPARGAIAGELMEHAEEEFGHAGQLVERILQLGGTPLLEPKDWYEKTNCGYEAPTDPNVEVLLEQNIKGEQCAIDTYKALMDFVGTKDQVTFKLALEIMEDEIEHEEDLQAFADDLALMKGR